MIARREVVPIGAELRALAWIGVMLMATGVGILIKNHFQEIGPLAIAITLAILAAACYVWVSLKSRAPLDDYIVLFGALLISADVGFIETQWHLLGSEWQRHFLLLAIVHAAAAYWFDSLAVLSLSIASLAAWFGVEQRNLFGDDTVALAIRAFVCAGAIVVWRVLNRRAAFAPLFDQFAIHIAFWGCVILTASSEARALGLVVTLILAAAVLRHGFRSRREIFIMYAFIYTLIVINILVAEIFVVFASTVVAIVGLFVIHAEFRKRVANA